MLNNYATTIEPLDMDILEDTWAELRFKNRIKKIKVSPGLYTYLQAKFTENLQYAINVPEGAYPETIYGIPIEIDESFTDMAYKIETDN